MKRKTSLLILTAGLIIASCTSGTETVTSDHLVGRWKLSKKEGSDKSTLDLTNKSTVLILNLESNGHFTYYDSVTDPKWTKTGVPRIQVQSSGQWELKDKNLILTNSEHENVETLKIETISDKELITKNSDKKSQVYTIYGK